MSDAENTLIMTLAGGDVEIALKPDLAPGHVTRLKELAREGFYNGLTFHRVIDGFVAQGGCPDGTGAGGTGKKLKAEFNEAPHVRGACSMARTSAPDSADCQFFICLDEVSYLDGQYTVWGEVVAGIEHVDALPKGEPPSAPGEIVSMKIAVDA